MSYKPDFNEVRGQADAIEKLVSVVEQAQFDPKRTMRRIQPVVLVGPPGSGKSMLAKRLPGILPDPIGTERLEIFTNRVLSRVVGEDECLRDVRRPFRAPHHTVSSVGMTGKPGRPGECSLAHGGVLFLDEMPEFRGNVFGAIAHAHEAGEASSMPAEFWLVMGANPCPCGSYGYNHNRKCNCSEGSIDRYRERGINRAVALTGAEIIEVPVVSYSKLKEGEPGPDSETLKARVTEAFEGVGQ